MIAAKPLDLSRTLHHAKNRVIHVGIELEGGWDRLPQGVELVRDGSVVFPPRITQEEATRLTLLYNKLRRGEYPSVPERTAAEIEYYALCDKRDGSGIPNIGEHPSPPLKVKGGQWIKWLTTNYPHHVNHTCGMHVHMSFGNDLIYQRLMEEDLSATILHYVGEWAGEHLPINHPIWERLEGRSEYCQHLFHAENQVKLTRKRYEHHEAGHRYTIMNYPYLQHKTIECRLLPMMEDAPRAITLIQYLLDVVNAYIITKYPAREVRKIASLEVEIPSTDNGFEQSFSITV